MILLLLMLMVLTGCSSFSMLLSGGSFAASQNSLVKVYNAADFGVVLTTKKGIKTHVYEKGKKYIYDNTVGLVHKH
jgi:starvation-inducible outer membrane lipoprotein